MSKRPRDKQIEMLLPITTKTAAALPTSKPIRTLSYDKVVDSLRKKGLTRPATKK